MHIFRILALAALVLVATGCRPDSTAGSTSTKSTAGSPGLVFSNPDAPRPYFHDFGDRLWGERIEHTWELTNREGRTVILQDLMPDCGCTMPRAAVIRADGTRVEGPLDTRGMDLEIPDGAKLEVRIGLDTTRVERPNQHKLAQVRLRCDSESTPYMTFELHVLVKRTFRAAPTEAVLKDVPQSSGKSVRLDVTTEIAGDGARIRGVEAVEGPFHAEVTAAEVGKETVWVLVVSADPGSTLGPHEGKVVLGTTLSDGTGVGQHFEVKVRAQVVEDYVIEPRSVAIPREADGAATATLHALVPGARVRIREARLDGGGAASLRAEYEAIAPGDDGAAERWRITVRAVGELPVEAFGGRLVVVLDDPSLPVVEVPYAAPSGAR